MADIEETITLIFCARSLDPDEKGFVLEIDFRKLLSGKAGISIDDIEDMIKEYKALNVQQVDIEDKADDDRIFYKDFVAMLKI